LLETATATYFVEASGRIVFANEALADWTGQPLEKLLGTTCAYHSQLDAGSDVPVSARLCPPPQAFHGERTVARIDFPHVQKDQVDARHVEFIPIWGKDSTVIGVMAIVDDRTKVIFDAQEHPTAVDGAIADVGPMEWHRLLDSVRRRAGDHFQLDRLLGESSAARRIRAQVELARSGRGHVLVIGPPGSGRQHVAKTVHHSNRRADATLVPLSCPLLGVEVLRSSLHALSKSPGGATAQGTLLLLEIDQLASDCQTELVAALERVDAPQIIATARQTLTELATRGAFREDLSLLASTLVIELPPLIERLDDLPLLVQALVEQHNASGSKQIGGCTPEALDRLAQYSWPGNFSELAEVVQQSHDRAAGPVIQVGDLPEQLELAAQAAARPRRADTRIVLSEFMGQVERELIERALRRAKGNKAKAARLLGMTRPRLYRRMVQLGLAK
jgi:DNA-binding NtrC family response regulator